MKLVDTHFHLDLQPDPAAVAADCDSKSVYTIAVTNAPSVFGHTQHLASTTKYVRAAVGLHPELVSTHHRELPELLRLIGQTRYVGEVGLDYVTGDTSLRATQRRVFEAVIARCAELQGRVVTIHSRRAAADVLACIGTSFPGTTILHWFGGALRDLRAGVAAGCYFSVNPAMVRSDRGRALIQRLPRERVLTESDGPFVDVGARRAVPSDVVIVIDGLAELWNVDRLEAAAHVFANFRTALQGPEAAS